VSNTLPSSQLLIALIRQLNSFAIKAYAPCDSLDRK
jgi:hypothetical protein